MRFVKDGSVGWVDMGRSKPNFKECTGIGRIDSIEAHMVGIHRACKQAAEYFDKKAVEVAGVKQGPLADVKATSLAKSKQRSNNCDRRCQLPKRRYLTNAEKRFK